MTDNHPTDTESTNVHPAAPSDVIAALDDHATSLATTDPTESNHDINAIRDHLDDARIVGLGEATHGTREFFQLKARLIQYLVTELDTRIVALEANLPETLAIDEYVVHGRGDPREALEGVYFWTWNVESILELLEWLRTFNADRPLEDQVRFYGVDAQYAHGAVERLRDFVGRVDPDVHEAVEGELTVVDAEGSPPHQDDDLADRVAAAERVLPTLRDWLDDGHEGTDATQREWARARRHATVIEQVTDYRRAMMARQAAADDAVEPIERCLAVRDRAMVNNLGWILRQEDPERVALWAHDGHLNRQDQRSRRTDATAPSLGRHLADRHGEDYLAVGFAFSRGSFRAMGRPPDGDDGEFSLREWTLDEPLPGTIAAALDGLDRPLAVVDVEAAADDGRAAEWLAQPRRHFSTGAVYDPSDPEDFVREYRYPEAFDLLCYVAETSRARPVERD